MHSWFSQDRFGLFIHFGLYSTLARHEWVMTHEMIPTEDYARRAPFFDPDLFDATEYARRAKAWGVKYAVLTAKHHEGFAMYDTELSDYSITTHTGRDLVAEFAAAMRAQGIKVGLYYSLIDWHHPDFTVDWIHPQREAAPSINDGRDMARYREFLHGQVRELLTNYGRIDYLFFDYTYPETKKGWAGKSAADWDAQGLLKMVRSLQPQILVNDRLGIPGDLVTPEQYQPDAPMRSGDTELVWEACQTLNGSWGYDPTNYDLKTPEALLTLLVDSVSKNGNLLLNVGPNGRGALPAADLDRLGAIGTWLDLHGASVYGAGASSIPAPPGTVLTQRGNRAYLHVLAWPFVHIHLQGMADKIAHARFLHDGAEVPMTEIDPNQEAVATIPGGQPAGTLTLTLPVRRPEVLLPVIELFLTER